MEQNHLISIIVPTHNRADTVGKALDSLINQTYKNIEIIVVHNKSTDNTQEILDNYAQRDNRIRVIHQEDKGYAGGINVGIENIHGDYFAILDADDWTAPEMYEKLLNRALETDADIVKCSFYYVRNEECTLLEECKYWYGMDKGLKVFNIKQVPDIVRYFASLWSCLYKKSFIDKYHIRMIETPQATYQDFSWMANTYSRAEKISILEEPLHYYLRVAKSNTASYYQDKKIFYMIYHCEEARKIFIETKVFNYVKEQYYIHAFRSCQLFGKRINNNLKNEYYERFKTLLNNSRKDNIKFKYFSKDEKKICKQILNNNYLKSHTTKKIKYNPLEYIFSVKNTSDKKHKILTLCGVKLKIKRRPSFESKLRKIIREEVSYITARDISDALMVQKLHSKTFPQFKNIHQNDTINIFGGGQSVKYYNYENRTGINIALNHMIFLDNINFSYLFNWDYKGTRQKEPKYFEKLKRYKDCKKFLGRFLYSNYEEYPDTLNNTENNVYRFYAKARVTLPGYNYADDFHYDIETYPLTDFMSVSFAAIQFALYTHPQKVYLIGLDTSQTGHFMGYDNKYHIKEMLTGYKKLKKFVGIYYPDIEIISVNPVGLKGLFKDVYTQSYVEAHPELKNENIEILKPELCETALRN